jgi:hypothetical protein
MLRKCYKAEITEKEKATDLFTGLYNDSMDFYNRLVKLQKTCDGP